MNSPFGKIWNLATQTGWSVEYILRNVNYVTLIMMTADAPRYTTKKQTIKINTKAQADALWAKMGGN